MARVILKSGKPITIETNNGTYTIYANGKIEEHPTKEELDRLYNDKRFPHSVTRHTQHHMDREAFEIWLAEQNSAK